MFLAFDTDESIMFYNYIIKVDLEIQCFINPTLHLNKPSIKRSIVFYLILCPLSIIQSVATVFTSAAWGFEKIPEAVNIGAEGNENSKKTL